MQWASIAAPFNAENMAFNTKTGADEADALRWVMLEQYRRIIMSNEIKLLLT
jgi:hypothetical protein